jgi:hypothetical protein
VSENWRLSNEIECENDASDRRSVLWRRGCAGGRARSQTRRQGEGLPDGAAMPLGKLQEDLHLRQGLSLISGPTAIDVEAGKSIEN